MVKVPTKREIPIAIPSREKPSVEQVIIKEVDMDERRRGKYTKHQGGHHYGHAFKGQLGEASWIQEGLD